MQKNKKILIFNVNWLGDVIFSTAAIRNIRRNFPESFIACVIPSHCYPILKDNPHLNEVIIFDEKDRHKTSLGKLKFIQILRRKKFDIAYLLHRSLTRALICRLAGIPERVGFDTKKRGFLLTKKITLPKKDSLHRIDFYLKVIEEAGLRVEDRFTEFFFTEKDEKHIKDWLKKNSIKKEDFLVILNPGGNWELKRWPKSYWSEIADKLILDFQAKVLITGSAADCSLAKEIVNNMKERPLITCGTFNIKHFAALARIADLVITADSGPLHIANSVGTKKIIALFGPTSPEITGPFPLKNVIILRKETGCKIPCYEVNCKDNRCMKLIVPDDVIKEIKLLRKK